MQFTKPTILMCRPTYFGVIYEINPWMHGNIERVEKASAKEQWEDLHVLVQQRAEVRYVEPQDGLPDLVFTANAGVVSGKVAVVSRFRHPERQGEERWFQEFFEAQGFETHLLPDSVGHFEGAGDMLYDRGLPIIWAGYGWRSDLRAIRATAEILRAEVTALRLVDERFYHLDTCLCPLTGGHLMYYPPAFDEASQRLIARLVPPEKRIAVADRDAMAFACNAINVGNSIILNRATRALRARLEELGFELCETPLTEFLRSGGAAKCLSLRLDDAPVMTAGTATRPMPANVIPDEQAAASIPAVLAGGRLRIATRHIEITGHLMDEGILNDLLDLISSQGGLFEIVEFQLGVRKEDTSTARLRIDAPNADTLERIMRDAVAFGVRPLSDDAHTVSEEHDAALENAELDGVVPADFAITGIHPTEVRVNGTWIAVEGLHLNGVIVVDGEQGERRARARCRLIRDVRRGDRVVVGVEGIRTHTPRKAADVGDLRLHSSGILSERRVEVAVEQIAWEIQRIRERQGRVVVAAGPVVVHTGGAPYLASLIREGYVSALLAGNALAVHDMEYALYGTSLGVDLTRGTPTRWGQKHHLRTINEVRRQGSIRAAVESGLVGSGIMFETIRRGIPFCLTGAIGDEGPLPDTTSDVLEAQRRCHELVTGADMVLLLSSMQLSMAVSTMTPAGVTLIGVDISPNVVGKLADRGGQDTMGIVTDVGLFLNLLAGKLHEA